MESEINLMKHKFTHTAKIYGDVPTSVMYPDYTTKIREGKLHWITESGAKFSKRSGCISGGTYPYYHLSAESITPIPAEN